MKFSKRRSECVKVLPGFYAHRDLITKEFHRHLDFEIKQINEFIRKELLGKTEVTIDELVPLLFDLQTKNFFSENGIRYFISNTPNLDDDLKRSYYSSMKKFTSKSKSEERQGWASTPSKTEHYLKNNHIHAKFEILKKKPLKDILETELSDLNLSVRSSNCLQNENVIQIKDLVRYKERDLLNIDNFGRKSLREINMILSSIGLRIGMSDEDIEQFIAQNGITTNEISSGLKNRIISPLDENVIDFDLSVRSENCLENEKIIKIRDLVKYSEKDLLHIDNFGRKSLREIKEILSPLGLRLGMTDADIEYFLVQSGATPAEILSVDNSKNDANTLFKAVPWTYPVVARFLVRIIVDERATAAEALNVKVPQGIETKISVALSSMGFRFFGSIYDEIYESLPEHLRVIAMKRTHNFLPKSLEELGTEFGLTRERVRQLEIKVRNKFKSRFNMMDVVVQLRVMKALIGKVTLLKSARILSKLLINPSIYPNCAFSAFLKFTGPYKVDSNWIIRSDVFDKVNSLKATIMKQADRIGRIDPLIIHRETAGLFRREEERDLFLIEYLNLPKVFDEWVTRDSMKRRVFLSLYKLGKPSTKEEIANYAGIENAMRVASYLGGNDFICRADKERWAFIEWVDDPYDGISGEIVQRINEDGGKTTIERILKEIPFQFGVAENSVRAYMATPKFIVSDGYIRCATQDEINSTYFGDVEDVSSAVHLEDGSWGVRIKVEERYLSGYSAAIPAPIALECGLKPGDSIVVPVDGTKHKVSMIWRVNSLLQTIDLGRIAPVLEDLGLKDGDEIVVVPSVNNVRIFRAKDAPILDSYTQEVTGDNIQIDSLMKVLFNR